MDCFSLNPDVAIHTLFDQRLLVVRHGAHLDVFPPGRLRWRICFDELRGFREH